MRTGGIKMRRLGANSAAAISGSSSSRPVSGSSGSAATAPARSWICSRRNLCSVGPGSPSLRRLSSAPPCEHAAPAKPQARLAPSAAARHGLKPSRPRDPSRRDGREGQQHQPVLPPAAAPEPRSRQLAPANHQRRGSRSPPARGEDGQSPPPPHRRTARPSRRCLDKSGAARQDDYATAATTTAATPSGARPSEPSGYRQRPESQCGVEGDEQPGPGYQRIARSPSATPSPAGAMCCRPRCAPGLSCSNRIVVNRCPGQLDGHGTDKACGGQDRRDRLRLGGFQPFVMPTFLARPAHFRFKLVAWHNKPVFF